MKTIKDIGRMGGIARARNMTKAARSSSAKKAARARWRRVKRSGKRAA